MSRQGFAWWSFAEGRTLPAEFLESAWSAGMRGIDFLPKELRPEAKRIGYQLLAIDGHPSVDEGANDAARGPELVGQLRDAIADAHEVGARFVTIAAGTRSGASDGQAMAACLDVIGRVADDARQAGVGILLEPLNSRYDHPGHQCDTVEWARAVIDRFGDPVLSLLFDVYHVQLMQGDVTNRLQDNADVLGHIHTAGVPGRAEIGPEQELNYGWVASVLDTIEYDGWVVHEFLTTRDPAAALRQAYEVFDRAR